MWEVTLNRVGGQEVLRKSFVILHIYMQPLNGVLEAVSFGEKQIPSLDAMRSAQPQQVEENGLGMRFRPAKFLTSWTFGSLNAVPLSPWAPD